MTGVGQSASFKIERCGASSAVGRTSHALDGIVIQSHIQGMYDVVVTEEFAGWFHALADAEAESVAALLGVVGELGPALGPPRARRALLWYDATGSAEPHPAEDGAAWRAHWRHRVDALEAFDGWRREALRCLESAAFSRLLAGLDGRAEIGRAHV